VSTHQTVNLFVADINVSLWKHCLIYLFTYVFTVYSTFSQCNAVYDVLIKVLLIIKVNYVETKNK
jgi:hypothetical protein